MATGLSAWSHWRRRMAAPVQWRRQRRRNSRRRGTKNDQRYPSSAHRSSQRRRTRQPRERRPKTLCRCPGTTSSTSAVPKRQSADIPASGGLRPQSNGLLGDKGRGSFGHGAEGRGWTGRHGGGVVTTGDDGCCCCACHGRRPQITNCVAASTTSVLSCT